MLLCLLGAFAIGINLASAEPLKIDLTRKVILAEKSP
jgi:hypothetical protein